MERTKVTQLFARMDELGGSEVTVVAGMFCPADTVERDGKTINRVTNTALIAGPGVLGGYDKILSTDSVGAQGDGLTMASAIGAELIDMQYIQTYPTCDLGCIFFIAKNQKPA